MVVAEILSNGKIVTVDYGLILNYTMTNPFFYTICN